MCAASRDYRRRNAEKVAESQAKWRAENKDHIAQYFKGWTEANRHKKEIYRQRENERHPEKEPARNKLHSAVFRGLIDKPTTCEDCGEEVEKRKLHGHHEDYSKPLDVEWLCVNCHVARHPRSTV